MRDLSRASRVKIPRSGSIKVFRLPRPGRTWRRDQGGAPKGPAPTAAMSEDCLFLNVWTAANSASDKRPVIVWSHPGRIYQRQRIVSTIRWRGAGQEGRHRGHAQLPPGRLWLFLVSGIESGISIRAPATTHSWIWRRLCDGCRKEHRGFHGGDPKRVTIAGDSAGAALVAMLTGSPEGKGLFQRIISESGAWKQALAWPQTWARNHDLHQRSQAALRRPCRRVPEVVSRRVGRRSLSLPTRQFPRCFGISSA